MSKFLDILPEIQKGRRYRYGLCGPFKQLDIGYDNSISYRALLCDDCWELEEEKRVVLVDLGAIRSDGGKFITTSPPNRDLKKSERRALAYAIMDILEEFKGERE